MKFSVLVNLLLLLCGFILPIFIYSNTYVMHILILIFMYIVLGETWNILAGFAGQINLGHNVFFGLGAYVSALLVYYYGISPWGTAIVGGLISMLFAFPFGAICFRLRGFYFALTTMALSEVVRLIILNWTSVTRGAMGVMLHVPETIKFGNILIDFTSKIPYYYIMFIMVIITVYVAYKIAKSRFGFQLLTVREDQDAALSLGINVFRLKLMALMVSTFLVGVTGAIYAHYILYIDASAEAGGVLSMVLGLDSAIVTMLGGVGTVYGPVVGALLRQACGEYLRVNYGWTGGGDLLIFGVILVFIILFLPRGIYGTLRDKYFSKRGF